MISQECFRAIEGRLYHYDDMKRQVACFQSDQWRLRAGRTTGMPRGQALRSDPTAQGALALADPPPEIARCIQWIQCAGTDRPGFAAAGAFGSGLLPQQRRNHRAPAHGPYLRQPGPGALGLLPIPAQDCADGLFAGRIRSPAGASISPLASRRQPCYNRAKASGGTP